MDIKHVLTGRLPLQTETSFFILANVLDVFLTYMLLVNGAIEANPFANFVLERWGFHAMMIFKLLIVAVVCIIAQLIATRRIRTARFLLVFGTILVGLVVAYSMNLYWTHYRVIQD
jgi:hypothetical protein